jgi:TrmH family RNA methyltransferase
MLTSAKNPRIQHIRKLQSSARARREESLFVVEGIRLLEEALTAGCQPEIVLYTEDIDQRGQNIISKFKDRRVEVLPVSPHVMQTASDTQNPQGILAVLPMRSLPMPELSDFLLILDGLRDPGNLGTILRTARAAGVDAVLLPPGGVDPFSPKVVRAGMGAHFQLPIHTMDWETTGKQFVGLTLFLADSSGGQPYHQSNFRTPLGIIIGGEAQGAGSQAQKRATSRIHIPMPGKAESLNAAVAAAILMFEVVRQRKEI